MTPECSIVISLKRLEIQKNRELQTWCVFKGFKEWHSSSWIAIQEEENKLLAELAELEKEPEEKYPVANPAYLKDIPSLEVRCNKTPCICLLDCKPEQKRCCCLSGYRKHDKCSPKICDFCGVSTDFIDACCQKWTDEYRTRKPEKKCICTKRREAGKWCGDSNDFCGANCDKIKPETKQECSCGEPWTKGVIHRTDEPCFWPPRDFLVEKTESYTHEDGSHAPECSGDDCKKLDGCPCICHETKRTKYYTKAETEDLINKELILLDKRFQGQIMNMKHEEKEFRKALLTYVDMRFMCRDPLCPKCKQFTDEMCSRFLPPTE